MDLELTQIIRYDSETDDEAEHSAENERKPVAQLVFIGEESLGLQEKFADLYEGDNYVGRHSDCNICIPVKCLTRRHACIEIQGESHLIYDVGSSNGTFRGKLKLKPNVRYEVKNNDRLWFGDVECHYSILMDNNNESEVRLENNVSVPPKPLTYDDSDTNDSLNLLQMPQGIGDEPRESGETEFQTANETTMLEEDSDDSINVLEFLKPTQAYHSPANNSNSRTIAADSDEEDHEKSSNEMTPAAKGNIDIKTFSVLETPAPTEKEDDPPTSPFVLLDSDEEIESDDSRGLLKKNLKDFLAIADTQDASDEDGDTADKQLLFAATQAYAVAESDPDETDDDDCNAKVLLTSGTQAFAVETNNIEENKKKAKSGKEDDISENEDEGSDTDGNDASDILFMPTLACDVENADIDHEEEEESEDEEENEDRDRSKTASKNTQKAEAASMISQNLKKDENTCLIDNKTCLVTDKTCAVDDTTEDRIQDVATVAVNSETERCLAVKTKIKKGAEEAEIATLAVKSDDATMEKTSDDATMAIKSDDATMAIKSDDATMAITSDDATMAIKSDDATMAIKSDDATMAITSDDATMAITSDDATMAIKSDDATMAIKSDDATMAITSDGATMAITSDDATMAITSDDATMAITSDDATMAITSDDATMPITSDDATMAISSDSDENIDISKKSAKHAKGHCLIVGNNKNPTNFEATQTIEEDSCQLFTNTCKKVPVSHILAAETQDLCQDNETPSGNVDVLFAAETQDFCGGDGNDSSDVRCLKRKQMMAETQNFCVDNNVSATCDSKAKIMAAETQDLCAVETVSLSNVGKLLAAETQDLNEDEEGEHDPDGGDGGSTEFATCVETQDLCGDQDETPAEGSKKEVFAAETQDLCGEETKSERCDKGEYLADTDEDNSINRTVNASTDEDMEQTQAYSIDTDNEEDEDDKAKAKFKAGPKGKHSKKNTAFKSDCNVEKGKHTESSNQLPAGRRGRKRKNVSDGTSTEETGKKKDIAYSKQKVENQDDEIKEQTTHIKDTKDTKNCDDIATQPYEMEFVDLPGDIDSEGKQMDGDLVVEKVPAVAKSSPLKPALADKHKRSPSPKKVHFDLNLSGESLIDEVPSKSSRPTRKSLPAETKQIAKVTRRSLPVAAVGKVEDEPDSVVGKNLRKSKRKGLSAVSEAATTKCEELSNKETKYPLSDASYCNKEKEKSDDKDGLDLKQVDDINQQSEEAKSTNAEKQAQSSAGTSLPQSVKGRRGRKKKSNQESDISGDKDSELSSEQVGQSKGVIESASKSVEISEKDEHVLVSADSESVSLEDKLEGSSESQKEKIETLPRRGRRSKLVMGKKDAGVASSSVKDESESVDDSKQTKEIRTRKTSRMTLVGDEPKVDHSKCVPDYDKGVESKKIVICEDEVKQPEKAPAVRRGQKSKVGKHIDQGTEDTHPHSQESISKVVSRRGRKSKEETAENSQDSVQDGSSQGSVNSVSEILPRRGRRTKRNSTEDKNKLEDSSSETLNVLSVSQTSKGKKSQIENMQRNSEMEENVLQTKQPLTRKRGRQSHLGTSSKPPNSLVSKESDSDIASKVTTSSIDSVFTAVTSKDSESSNIHFSEADMTVGTRPINKGGRRGRGQKRSRTTSGDSVKDQNVDIEKNNKRKSRGDKQCIDVDSQDKNLSQSISECVSQSSADMDTQETTDNELNVSGVSNRKRSRKMNDSLDSSQSSETSTKKRQRQSELKKEIPHTPAKRSRQSSIHQDPSNQGESHLIGSPSLRHKSDEPKPKVMFTGVVDEHGEKILKDLGGSLANSLEECTHLVTDKVRRTVKFLCSVSKGIPIVIPKWLDSCKISSRFVDVEAFLVKDTAAEKQYKFTLHRSLEKAAQKPMLAGFKVHVTKSVKPDPSQMKEILEFAGAQFLPSMPKKHTESVLVISCEDDKAACDSALKVNIPVVSAEFVLTGILRQEADIDSFRIFTSLNAEKVTTDVKENTTRRRRR